MSTHPDAPRVIQSNEVAEIVIAQAAEKAPNLFVTLDFRYAIADALWAAGYRKVEAAPSDPRRNDVIDPEDGKVYYGMIPVAKVEAAPSDTEEEALVELLTSSQHAPMETHDGLSGECLQCPWPLHALPPEEIANAVVAAGFFRTSQPVPSDTDLPQSRKETIDWLIDLGVVRTAAVTAVDALIQLASRTSQPVQVEVTDDRVETLAEWLCENVYRTSDETDDWAKLGAIERDVWRALSRAALSALGGEKNA